VPLKLISPFASPSSSESEEGKRFTKEISEASRFVENIEEMTRPLLERLWRGIFRRRIKVAMGLIATTQELVDIQESNDKKKKKVLVQFKDLLK
jgi:uncharacterized protein with von Willebrand factor type A (vWA) domain